jgi:hypothetical protein
MATRTVVLLLLLGAPAWALTENLAISAASTPNNWALTAGATKQAAVAAPNDDATSYLSSSATINTQQQFAITDTAIPAGAVISEVATTHRAKRNGANNANHSLTLILGGNTTVGTTRAAPSTFTTWTETLARPGGGSWSTSDINSLEVRAENLQARDVQLTTLYITVTYTLPGAKRRMM